MKAHKYTIQSHKRDIKFSIIIPLIIQAPVKRGKCCITIVFVCLCLNFFLMAYVSGDSLMSRRMAATGRKKKGETNLATIYPFFSSFLCINKI